MRHFLVIILLIIFSQSNAQQVAKTWVTPDGWTAGLLVYTPPGIDTMTVKPGVIIYSHGNGESGSYPSGPIAAANALTGNEIPRLLTGSTLFRFQEGGTGQWRSLVVISIARKSSEAPFSESASNRYVDWSLKYMRDSLADKVDTNKIYLVGISGGGAVGWLYPGASVANAQKINANVLVCPTTETTTWCNIATGNTPIWAFHAKNDGTTPASSTIGAVAAINACGIATAPILDTPATGGHGIWPTYLDTNYVGSNGMNVYEWMLQYPLPQVYYPPGVKLGITPKDIFDISCAAHHPDLLYDGDTLTVCFQNFFNGYILDQTDGQQAWIVLDSFIQYPRVEIFNKQFASGGQVDFQFYYDWTDTTRHSDIYSTTLGSNTWKWADSINSRTYSDSSRLVRMRIASGSSDNFSEVRIFGTQIGPAASIFPAYTGPPPTPGKRWQGYNKLQVDTMMNDAGWVQRASGDMDYIDTPTVTFTNGKTITINKFSNSIVIGYRPAIRNGVILYPYFSGPRLAFKYPSLTNDSKDIPIGSDSTNINTWVYTYNTYYGLAAKMANNASADLTGYTFQNTPAGAGLGVIDEITVGNEDMGRWKGLGFHRPDVLIYKWKQGYNGAKAADPTIRVLSGALTGIDTPYYKAMYITNLIKYKTKTVPWDGSEVNEYATNAGGQHAGSTVGISPESFQLFQKSNHIMTIRDSVCPGCPLYFTEFGYDTHTGSNYVVPDIPGQTRQFTKACWVMRGMEIAAATKWSRFYQYTHLDIPGGDFSTTGIAYDTFSVAAPSSYLPAYMEQVVDPDRWNATNVFFTLPRELYWHMVMRARLIQNYYAWPEVISNGDSTGVWVLKYTHQTRNDSVCYSVWKGTHTNSTTSNYPISVPYVVGAKISHATIGDKDGTVTAMTPGTNQLVVTTVDESVQYIQARVLAIRNYFRGSLKNGKFVNASP